MIGNDVVDLRAARLESDWRRRGYLSKIFTSSEQDFIHGASHPEIAVWTLWSRKEAVYKIINRESGIRLFNPLAFENLLTDGDDSRVGFKNQIYFTQSNANSHFVHTTAVSLAQDFHNLIELQPLEIIKRNHLPFFICNERVRPASVSHHGNYYFAVGIRS